jgi:hypothetical protein
MKPLLCFYDISLRFWGKSNQESLLGGGEGGRVIMFNALLTIFHLYHGGQIYWWRKLE